MRGILAEQIIDFTPNQNGNSYYSFRIGSVWGVVLDCGEDKDDDHPEYNHTVCCGNFRRRQTEYLESIVRHADREYAAEGVEHRIVVVHNPFPCIHRMDPPFLNETDRYAEWTKILGDSIKPDVMLAGHYHRLEVARDGDNPRDGHLPFTVLFGAQPTDDDFAGCGMVFRAGSRTVDVTFTNNADGIIGTDTIVP